jgi:sRNA-binding protein
VTTQYQARRAAQLKDAASILARMKERHPAAFPFPPRPLKIGVRADLMAAGWTEEEVSAALAYYLKTRPYLQCTYAEGAFRIDLNGCPSSPVQDYEAEWARQQVRTGQYIGSGAQR